MRVYAEVCPSWLGQAIYRVNREMRRYAPPGVKFVRDPTRADLQVLDVIGMGSVEYLRRPDSYVLIQYCYLTTEDPKLNRWLRRGAGEARPPANRAEFWLPYFARSRLVMSYYDLPAAVGSDAFAFYHAPLGVDGGIFFDRKKARTACILTSGYEPQGEAIRECREAARRVNQPLIHLGPWFDFFGDGCLVVNGISDDELAGYYSQARYVSGLRRGEGFELPVVEGLACGARPVCFDQPCYRTWFEGHAVFVPELEAPELIECITAVLGQPAEPVSESERNQVLERFSWENIFGEFWRRVLETV